MNCHVIIQADMTHAAQWCITCGSGLNRCQVILPSYCCVLLDHLFQTKFSENQTVSLLGRKGEVHQPHASPSGSVETPVLITFGFHAVQSNPSHPLAYTATTCIDVVAGRW